MKKSLVNQKRIVPISLVDLPELFRNNVINLCSQNNLELNDIEKVWYRPQPLDDKEGWIGIIQTTDHEFAAVAMVPGLSFKTIGRKLTIGEVMELHYAVGSFSVPPGISIDEHGTYLHIFMNIKPIQENQIVHFFDFFQDELSEFRLNLLKISNQLFDLHLEKKYSNPKPKIPEIKIFPSDIKMLEIILSCCDEHTQAIFNFLMKQWDKLGYQITTTSTMISMSAPYGNRSIRMLYLMPGGFDKKPVIGLSWEGLSRFKAIPKTAISSYFKSVEKFTKLQKTETAAYIEVTDKFTNVEVKKLVQEIEKVVKSIKPFDIEKPLPSQPRTANGISATLAKCNPEEQEIFNSLISAWQEMGGIVHCQRPGRIYLRLKTKPHKIGLSSKDSHTFNFLTLSTSKGRLPTRIEPAWDLATGSFGSYLDCIPVDVDKYESALSQMSGFTRHGTIRYIPAVTFTVKTQFQKLVNDMENIKRAEENAP